MTDEFVLIEKYFAPLTKDSPASLSLKDDAAVFESASGFQQVITKDILVENVHFFSGDDPKKLAQKALRVNLSDLAAMGATPFGYCLGLVLPKNIDESWIAAFASGLKEVNQAFTISLLGGDTTAHEGALVISVTMLGNVPQGEALTRKGAKPGNGIYVSGTLGDGALGLAILQDRLDVTPAQKHYLCEHYYRPEPRISLGTALFPHVTACMDISDGLVQDMGHIAKASGVGAEIHQENVPLSDGTHLLKGAMEAALSGGDDYELLFTAPPENEEALQTLAEGLGLTITRIGKVIEGRGVKVVDAAGKAVSMEKKGYRHF